MSNSGRCAIPEPQESTTCRQAYVCFLFRCYSEPTFNKGVSFSLLAFEGDTSQAALAYLPQTRERLPVQERLAPTRHRDARHVRWGRSPGQIGPPNLFYDPENPLERTRIEKALRRHCVAGASRAIRVTMAGEFDLHLGCQNQISRTTCAHALLLPDLIRQSTATP